MLHQETHTVRNTARRHGQEAEHRHGQGTWLGDTVRGRNGQEMQSGHRHRGHGQATGPGDSQGTWSGATVRGHRQETVRGHGWVTGTGDTVRECGQETQSGAMIRRHNQGTDMI
jgi:hypothetical protein